MLSWWPSPLRLFAGYSTLGAALFTFEYLTNPLEPALAGTARYGTTYAGELTQILGVTGAEILVAAVILRPWSYRRSWGRALLCALAFAPWLALWGALGLHAGPTTHAHTTWLLLFWLGLVTAAAVSGAAAVRARTRTSPAAP